MFQLEYASTLYLSYIHPFDDAEEGVVRRLLPKDDALSRSLLKNYDSKMRLAYTEFKLEGVSKSNPESKTKRPAFGKRLKRLINKFPSIFKSRI